MADGDQEHEVRRLDPSRLTYPEWIQFFFDRPIQEKVFWDEIREYDEWTEIAEPVQILQHLQRLCLEHKAIREVYSPEQVEQGLWAIFATYMYESTLFEPTVDVEIRIQCVESMYDLYANVVAHLGGDGKDGFYWMWWDYICHEVYEYQPRSPDLLSKDRQRILEVVMRTLVKILELHTAIANGPRCTGLDMLITPKSVPSSSGIWIRMAPDFPMKTGYGSNCVANAG